MNLDNDNILLFAVDGPRGLIFYSEITPESDDEITVETFGAGPGAGGNWCFNDVTDISVDKWGNIAFTEGLTNLVRLFRYVDGEVFWVDNDDWDLNLDCPQGVCIAEMDNSETDDDNIIVIADSGNDRILIVDFDGEELGEYTSNQIPSQIKYPIDVEWCGDETENSEILYVVDGENRRTVKLQGALNNLAYQYCCYNAGPYTAPNRLTLDVKGHVYVLDSYYFSLFKYKDTGQEFVELFHTPGMGMSNGRMYLPNCVSIPTPYNHLIVTEEFNATSGAVLFKIDLEVRFESLDNRVIDPLENETATVDYKLTDFARDFEIVVYNDEEEVVRTLEDTDLKEVHPTNEYLLK